MTKRIDRDLYLLDSALALSRRLESENLPSLRMQMGCGHVETPLGDVPVIVQTPFPALVRPTVHTERGAFARFDVEQPWPESRRELLEALQAREEAPIVCLAEAFVRFVRHGDECVLTVGTRSKPGWTNADHFPPAAFDYLAAMAPGNGCLVDFDDPSERRGPPPAPAKEREISWADIHRRSVGERALTIPARPRERLILLLAVHQRMDPAEISKLNLAQVREKYGRDYRPRVYLKQQLVRKKDVADALLQYRKRDREGYSFWDPKEPLFRDASKPARRWRSARLGTGEIAAVLERYARRAIKTLPPAPAAPEPPPLPPPPPLFWIADVEYLRQ